MTSQEEVADLIIRTRVHALHTQISRDKILQGIIKMLKEAHNQVLNKEDIKNRECIRILVEVIMNNNNNNAMQDQWNSDIMIPEANMAIAVHDLKCTLVKDIQIDQHRETILSEVTIQTQGSFIQTNTGTEVQHPQGNKVTLAILIQILR